MTARGLARLLVAWVLVTAVACLAVHRAFALRVDEGHPGAVILTLWQGGKRVAREVDDSTRVLRPPSLDITRTPEGAKLVYESVVASGPVLTWPEPLFALSFVPGRDGLSVTLDGRTAYVTPDDLLAAQAYDHGIGIPSMQIAMGLDVQVALAAASDDLGVSVRDLLDRASFRRIRVTRSVPGAPAARAATADHLDDAEVRDAALAMGRYLARGVDADGRFRYLVDAPTNKTLPGYDWPRHAGATYFVAQVAARTGEPDVRYAALRAAGLLRDRALLRCGEHRCIGDDDVATADVGSTALTMLAFVEIARTKLDEGYALLVPGLAAFLRAQQRPDGELMHVYDRAAKQPVDVQMLYFSGEAALALARAHSLLGDPRDLDAATRALAYLVGPGWSFFGSRYYWGEEHWTCQTMDDLWERIPAATRTAALDFCLGWESYSRKLQYGPGETELDAEGAYGLGPIVTPRLTPVGSRAEAGLATLEAATRAGRSPAELAALELQMRRSIALVLRHQLGTLGREYLLAEPAAVEGAMPGSEVDWQLRIDYAQHSGCALLRWIDRHEWRSGTQGGAGVGGN
jgi:hypothetical protein